MDDNKVSFEEENFGQPNYVGEQDGGNWMIRFLLKVRLVETQTQAFYVILAVIILVIILSIVIFAISRPNNNIAEEFPLGETVVGDNGQILQYGYEFGE